MNQNQSSAPPVNAVCRLCTIRLEALCYKRAWWFRIFREVLATGVRLFALVYRIKPENFITRSPACHGCFRFKKNALKEQSALFQWLDSFFNPLFNRVRDSLLTPEELAEAKEYALDAAALVEAEASVKKDNIT